MTRRQVLIAVLVVLAAIVAFFIFVVPAWFWHPLGLCPKSLGTKAQNQCLGYNWHSGLGSDLGEVTLVSAALAAFGTFWHQHNCHVYGCPWLCWHTDPETGHPVCKKHHPHHRKGGGGHPGLDDRQIDTKATDT